MGNQQLKAHDQMSKANLDIVCSLTEQDYASPNCLKFDPFLSSERILPSQDLSATIREVDLQISRMMDEGVETQTHMSFDQEEEKLFVSSPQEMRLIIQKNFSQKRKMIKKHSQSKQAKKGGKSSKMVEMHPVEPQSEQLADQSKENPVEGERIRDQNNCKSYHKLVKNYLVSKNLGHLIQSYEEHYPTKYYFVIALIIIKHHLKEDFSNIYQQIAEREVEAQQKKIEKKTTELSKIKKQIHQAEFANGDCSALVLKMSKLLNQIDHIRVLKHYIGNYSTRSCAAFFQGNTEESLKILYLKDDAEMKKKYYFQEALLILKQIETQVRKVNSHA